MNGDRSSLIGSLFQFSDDILLISILIYISFCPAGILSSLLLFSFFSFFRCCCCCCFSVHFLFSFVQLLSVVFSPLLCCLSCCFSRHIKRPTLIVSQLLTYLNIHLSIKSPINLSLNTSRHSLQPPHSQSPKSMSDA